MNYVDFHCEKPFHCFARYGEDIHAFHLDGDFYQLCERAEFNLEELLDDDLPRMVSCPGCDKNTLNEDDHVRACIGYQKPYTREEIEDAYSGPTERAKRDGLLALMDRRQI